MYCHHHRLYSGINFSKAKFHLVHGTQFTLCLGHLAFNLLPKNKGIWFPWDQFYLRLPSNQKNVTLFFGQKVHLMLNWDLNYYLRFKIYSNEKNFKKFKYPNAKVIGPFNVWDFDIFMQNKKVLLHECKRHTANHVASTRSAALSNPDLVRGGTKSQVHWGGTPSQVRGEGGTPSQVWGEYPVPGPGGTPSQVRGGTLSRPGPGGYPIQTWSFGCGR